MKISPRFFTQHRDMFRDSVSRPGEFWFAAMHPCEVEFVQVVEHPANQENEQKILDLEVKKW